MALRPVPPVIRANFGGFFGVQRGPPVPKAPKVVQPLKPCSKCANQTKESTLEIYRGMCRECHLKFIERSPSERRRFLEFAAGILGISDPMEFLQIFFEDDEAFDEFLEYGPRKLDRVDISNTLHERFWDQDIEGLSGEEVDKLILSVYDGIRFAWKEFDHKR